MHLGGVLKRAAMPAFNQRMHFSDIAGSTEMQDRPKKNPLSIAAEGVLLFGSSTWARTRDLRINRNPGSSKIYINQRLIGVFIKRVIFRAITPKVTLCNFPAKTSKFALSRVILHPKVRRLAWGSRLFSKKLDAMRGHQALFFVVTDGFDIHAGGEGKFLYLH